MEEIAKGSSHLWLQYMRQGAFEKAWEFSDAVLQERRGKPCWHWPRHYQYIWDGTPLQGKRVLVRCYHGLGDTIQFIRYMPLLKAVAAEVIVWAQAPLIPLIETVEGVDRILPLHDGTPEVAYDVDVESMELPHIFRTTLQTIPATIPYLHVAPKALPKKPGQLAVGLVWQGGDWDESRSLLFEQLQPLAKVEGVQFFILQANAAAAGWDGTLGVPACGSSLYEDACTIKGLDLLISVDTMTAHLAGALGTNVWNLLQADADWRWMEGRADSPWYPTMRLFRQSVPGDWNGVVEEVIKALQALTKK